VGRSGEPPERAACELSLRRILPGEEVGSNLATRVEGTGRFQGCDGKCLVLF
jgi:hypothetical protein